MQDFEKIQDMLEIENVYELMKIRESYGKIILHFEKGKLRIIQQEIVVKLTQKKSTLKDA